jgi:hypothetical protein
MFVEDVWVLVKNDVGTVKFAAVVLVPPYTATPFTILRLLIQPFKYSVLYDLPIVKFVVPVTFNVAVFVPSRIPFS